LQDEWLTPDERATKNRDDRRLNKIRQTFAQTARYIHEAYLSTVDPNDTDAQELQLAYLAEIEFCYHSGQSNITDPRAYAAKYPRKSDPDMPTFMQAMNGEHAEEYIKDMKLEVATLVQQDTWKYVPRLSSQHVLKGTWAFKLKRLPDGTAYRFKARYCARGDMQRDGIDFSSFETYAPVVSWSTIRLFLSTVLTEGWHTRQVDYTNAFAQAELHEEVYVEQPKGFKLQSGTDKVLRLLKSLYGIRQAPRTFFLKLREGLIERGYTQSAIDPCLFLKDGIMCVVYVDDTIFGGADAAVLEAEIIALGVSTSEQQHKFALRNEGEVGAFLGIDIKKTGPNEFYLTQTGLIDKIINSTGMGECNGAPTPCTQDPVHKDVNGAGFNETWEYRSVIGMLMYLSANSRPDISYSVHQCARFSHEPRKSHGTAIKRIVRYLKETRMHGLYLKPTDDHRVDCYVDADFAGLYSTENSQDPLSVKSRTGYVIMYRGAPLLWVSKLQTQIALSTMEAEYIALSQSMRDLIPIREILKEIMTIVFKREATIKYSSHSKAFSDAQDTVCHNIEQSTVFEDNQAALKFARMPKLSPRTKHIGIPYHWFRTKVESLDIHIEAIDTDSQLGDSFTKGLATPKFLDARKSLMGW
jgi:hypothetical protein